MEGSPDGIDHGHDHLLLDLPTHAVPSPLAGLSALVWWLVTLENIAAQCRDSSPHSYSCSTSCCAVIGSLGHPIPQGFSSPTHSRVLELCSVIVY